MDKDPKDTYICPPLCRRIHPRFIIEDAGEVITEDDQVQPIVVKDISVKGARIVGNFPLNVDQKIFLNIRSGVLVEPVICKKAEVRWAAKINENLWTIGLNFDLDTILAFTRQDQKDAHPGYCA